MWCNGPAGKDTVLAEPFSEAVAADRASGLPAGERPGRGAVIADGGVAAAGGEKLPDEVGEGLGRDDRLAPRPNPPSRPRNRIRLKAGSCT